MLLRYRYLHNLDGAKDISKICGEGVNTYVHIDAIVTDYEKPYFFKWLHDVHEWGTGTSFEFIYPFFVLRQRSNIEYVTRSPHAQTKGGIHFCVHSMSLTKWLGVPSTLLTIASIGLARHMFAYFDASAVNLRVQRRTGVSRIVV